MAAETVKEISVFVDESGSYDSDETTSLYYMMCLVFHDQQMPIDDDLRKLSLMIENVGKHPEHCIHTAPLIRRENEYQNDSREIRRALFFKMLSFVRKANIRYKCFVVDKRYIDEAAAIHEKLKRDLAEFLSVNALQFSNYDKIKVYYDNGQDQVKKVLESAFKFVTAKTEFVPEVTPARYRLFQAADLICTLELMRRRIDEGIGLNKSESLFFGNARLFKRNVLSQLSLKEF